MQIVKILSALGEAEFQTSDVKERIRIDTYDHYADHTGQILRWLDAAESTRRED